MMFVITRRTKFEDLPEYLRIDEAAAYLGCSTGILYAQVKRSELAVVYLGPSTQKRRLIRIHRDALAAYLAKDKVSAA
jgi:excisionase family DNA binding protein